MDHTDIMGGGADRPGAEHHSSEAPTFPRGRRPSKGAADPAVVRAARLFEIVRRIATQRESAPPITRPQLAAFCTCDVRTISRDLDLLRSQGAVDFDQDHRRYFVPDRALESLIGGSTNAGACRLTLPDALALALARGTLAASGVPHRDAILAALDKATATLPPKLASLFAAASTPVGTDTLPRDYSGAPVVPLLDAAAARRTVRIDYHSYRSNERRWRWVDPYEVAPRQGIFWEMHGFCHTNQRLLTFALDCVFDVETTATSFTRDEAAWTQFVAEGGEAISGLRGNGTPVAADIRFSPEVATYVRAHRWPASLTLSDDIEGALRLTGTVGHVDGMVTQLLRWRRHARVLGGPELRAAYREEIAAIAAAQDEK